MSTHCSMNPHEAGMTLVEVMVAVAIFAIGILAVGSMQTTSLRSATTSRENTEASAIAAHQLERLIRLSMERRDDDSYYGYRDAAELQDGDLDRTAGLDDATEDTADHAVARGRYMVFWNVAVGEELDGEPIEGTKRIRIIVVWTDRGAERRYPLDYVAVDVI